MKIRNLNFIVSFIFVLLFSQLILAQSLDEILKQADDYIDNQFNNEKALEVLQKGNKLYPDNWEIGCRLSRVYVNLADQMPASTSDQKDAQLAEYHKALDMASNAVKEAPDQANPYLRRAIANGKIALFKGVFSVGGVVNSVKDDCEKAITLGNGGNFVQALAHYVLARTNAKVSEKWAPARAVLGLGWADLDVAFKEYKKAISIYPNFRMFYLDLAKAYIRDDDYVKARENLTKISSIPKKEFNDDKVLAESKQLLEDIKDE